jgi:hypothetical protein
MMLVLFGAAALGLTPFWPLIGGALLLTAAALAALFHGEQSGFPHPRRHSNATPSSPQSL